MVVRECCKDRIGNWICVVNHAHAKKAERTFTNCLNIRTKVNKAKTYIKNNTRLRGISCHLVTILFF